MTKENAGAKSLRPCTPCDAINVRMAVGMHKD